MLAMAHSVLLDIWGVASVPVSITVGRLLVTNSLESYASDAYERLEQILILLLFE